MNIHKRQIHFNHHQTIHNWAIDLPNEKSHPLNGQKPGKQAQKIELSIPSPIELKLQS